MESCGSSRQELLPAAAALLLLDLFDLTDSGRTSAWATADSDDFTAAAAAATHVRTVEAAEGEWLFLILLFWAAGPAAVFATYFRFGEEG